MSYDGQISIYGVVDREKTPVLTIDVVAEDRGYPVRLSNIKTVTVQVLDVNDNKPQFVRDEGEFMGNKYRLPKHEVFKLNISLDTTIGTVLEEVSYH